MEILDRIYRALERSSLFAVWMGGLSMLLAAIMIVIEVLGRKIGGTEVFGVVLPSFRVPGSDEYAGYVFAGATAWAYAYCLVHRSHIRIDALYNLFPAKVRAVLDVIGLALLGAYILVLTERAWVVLLGTLDKGSRAATPQQTPLWLPQTVWVTGLTFFAIVTVFVCFYALMCLLTGRSYKVQRLAGTMSVQEEVDSETKGVVEMKK
ncbi:MAG: TRAP transporter small permease [Paracoccaceae bacterium]|nr:TRAP transporter small permease [Paracoccaceae bacterium]